MKKTFLVLIIMGVCLSMGACNAQEGNQATISENKAESVNQTNSAEDYGLI